MQYRNFDKIGVRSSSLGFGLMRLPVGPGGRPDVCYDLVTEMIHHAIERGVTYFDTAYVYHDGFSEVAFRKAMEAYPEDRAKVTVASKLPIRDGQTESDWEKLLDTSRERLGVDAIDFYLLHGINRGKFEQYGTSMFRFLDKMVSKGKIKYPSFSFHDDFNSFKELIDAYDWQMAQVQFNLLDTFKQATLEGVRYAGSKNVPIVVMEPLRGGGLARNIPESIQAIYDEYPTRRSPIEWAFRYVYDQPEVKVVLSGMGEMEQVDQNIDIFERSEPSCMDAQEKDIAERVRKAYESRTLVGCTGCRYCEPGCPQEIEISNLFRRYNEAYMLNNEAGFADYYRRLVIPSGHSAGKCIGCGQCESACPQHLNIIKHLGDIAAKYE